MIWINFIINKKLLYDKWKSQLSHSPPSEPLTPESTYSSHAHQSQLPPTLTQPDMLVNGTRFSETQNSSTKWDKTASLINTPFLMMDPWAFTSEPGCGWLDTQELTEDFSNAMITTEPLASELWNTMNKQFMKPMISLNTTFCGLTRNTISLLTTCAQKWWWVSSPSNGGVSTPRTKLLMLIPCKLLPTRSSMPTLDTP